MIDFALHRVATAWFSIAWNPERPQHPQVAYAASSRDATLAAIRKLFDAEDASLAVEAEDALPVAQQSATDIDGIRRVLNANMGGVVVIDYVRGDGTPTPSRRIQPREIKRRTPQGGFMPEEYVVADDLASDEPREFYLTRIGRASIPEASR